jgi:hypothetical protein
VTDTAGQLNYRGIIGTLLGLSLLAGSAYWVVTAPAYSFNPFCTYGDIYRLDGTIEVDGVEYSSHVVRQTTRSRKWIQAINYAGCKSTHGTALAFRLRDRQLVLIRATICSDALRAMHKAPSVDVTAYCEAIDRNRSRNMRFTELYPEGFLVDDAERPAFWWPVFFGEPVTEGKTVIGLVSLTARAARGDAWDDLDRTAPGLLESSFDYNGSWHQSPDAIITFERRRPYWQSNGFLYRVQPR